MAITARYWRVRELAAPAESLSFGDFEFGETPGDGTPPVSISGLVLSASTVPTSGAVSEINDGSLITSVLWDAVGSLAITWDFGSPRTVGAHRCTFVLEA